MKELLKNIRDWGATLLGLITAIATAWITIDWSTFDISRDFMKLVLSAVIALGGYSSTLKKPKDKTNINDNAPS